MFLQLLSGRLDVNWRAPLAAMPDMNYELQKILGADDDYVIIAYILRGTQEGEFMGIAPTHKKIEMHGCVISKIKDGKRYVHRNLS